MGLIEQEITQSRFENESGHPLLTETLHLVFLVGTRQNVAYTTEYKGRFQMIPQIIAPKLSQ